MVSKLADLNLASVSSCETYFQKLGSRVDRLWNSAQRDELAFPQIATTVLLDEPPNECISLWDAVKFGILIDRLPYQEDLDASFGQPPLTVYWNHDFRIELLFWIEGAPGIHQHAFSGAFHVMQGSSLHSVWTFASHHRLASRFFCGKLSLARAELLRTGNTRSIIAGEAFIHCTYHLDRPSISVVVRTNREEMHLPQYVYLPPSVSYDARQPGPVKRRIQLLKMLRTAGRVAELFEMYLHLFETADTYSSFHYLFQAYSDFAEACDRNRLLATVRRKHPQLAGVFQPVHAFQERRDRIVNLRRRLTNPDLQFFLALLLNIPERTIIFDLIRERYAGGEPLKIIERWLNELCQLGVPELGSSDAARFLRSHLLANTPLSDLEKMLREKFGYEASPDLHDDLTELANAFWNHWLLAPLFRNRIVGESARGNLNSTILTGA